MQGEFRGDFTRDTFDPVKHFSRVLMQQGRVQLDADWNEQTSILLHYLRTLAVDLRGTHWGPAKIAGADNTAFAIVPLPGVEDKDDFSIGSGRYYVDGILCEAETATRYRNQGEFRIDEPDELERGLALAYLDVWERHLTFLEDDRIREVALGGPDTATRAKVVWQVKVIPPDLFENDWQAIGGLNSESARRDAIDVFISKHVSSKPQPITSGRLRAFAKEPAKGGEPCAISPQSRYRGLENHLYRVEIHNSGDAWDKVVDDRTGAPAGNIDQAASFKWSRDNGSVALPIISLGDGTVRLASLGRDSRSTLRVNDWVEILDDDLVLSGRSGILRQVRSIDALETSVSLADGPEPLPSYGDDSTKHPLLRRWDFRDDLPLGNGLTLKEGSGDDRDAEWIELEDGIQIQFTAPTALGESNTYRAGDYWLIPARTVGDIEWPKEMKGGEEVPVALGPHGIDHHYAPLAVIETDDAGKVKVILDCRRRV